MADKEIKVHRRVIRMILPMIQRAKNDRSVRRALPVYDNDREVNPLLTHNAQMISYESTNSSFNKKLSSSMTIDIAIVHLVTTFRTLTVSLDPRPTTDMAWSGWHDMVYGMFCRAWNGIWYSLEGMAGYMVLPGGHGTVYGIVWRGMGWYMVWHSGMTFIWYGLTGIVYGMV